MKGGTTQTQQTSQTDTANIKKPTAEQIRYAQLLNNEDLKVFQDQIKQVADVTGRSHDEVSVALHDCNYDTEQAINTLLEGSTDQNEWITSSSRKKKHQGTGQGIDNIIGSGPRQSRGTRGGRNRSSDKNWESDQRDNDENRPPESGRGRGLRDDRSSDRKPSGGRGGLSRRGRGGSKGRSSSRGRGGKIGRSGPPAAQPINNGPTENGTEMWDSPEPNNEKSKAESWEDSVKPSENWGTEDYIHLPPSTVKEPVAPASVSSLFSSVQQSSSWGNSNKEQVTSWVNSDSVSGTVISNGPSVASTREQATDNTPFAPESVDMAIIHSKIAQSPSRSEQSQINSDMPMMHLPLHGGVNHNHLGPISKLLDNVSVTSLSQQTTPSVSHAATAAQPQRQPKQSKTRKSQKSQIPLQPVEMPGSMVDDLDVQFGNLEFGGDFSGSPKKGQATENAVSLTEEHLVTKQKDVSVSRPVESEGISKLSSTLSSTLSRSVPITIASTTSATSSLTGLEDSSPRHYQHASPREHKSQMKPEPIAFPKQPRNLSEDPQPSQAPERSRSPPTIAAASNDKSSLGVTRSQPISSATLQSQLVSSLPKETTLDSRVYQVNQNVSSQPLASKDQLSASNLAHHSTLGGSTMATSTQRSESSSSHTIHPPPGVGVPHSTAQQVTSSMGLSTATVSSSNRPTQHSVGKPSLPPGVLPMSTLYGIQQPGMVPAYSMPFNYEDFQRQMQMAAYYDMMQAQAPLQGRDNLQGTYQTDQKFGRSDASSPVQTTMNQANQGQHHLQQQQQQAYLNAGTMPPYGYGGLAFYPSGVMPGGFTTYSGPQMYQQMAPKTHGSVSQYQAYTNQHGTHNYSSGYDDVSVGHDFGKSPYHSAVSQAQSKSTSVVSTSTELGGGSSYKTQIGKFGDSKAFLGGTPPPALNLSVQGQHNHLGNYPGHTTPYVSMMPPAQQQHPHSLFHHHPAVPHQDVGQTGMSQRGQQSQLSKQSQNKGGHQGAYPGQPFWSSATKS